VARGQGDPWSIEYLVVEQFILDDKVSCLAMERTTAPKVQLGGYSNIAARCTSLEIVKFLDGNRVEGPEVGCRLGSCGA
jgi:hypothetical protein